MTLVYETLAGEDLDLGATTTTKSAPGGGSLSSTKISLSTFALDGATTTAATVTWNPGAIASLSSASTTVTVPGAAFGDMALSSLTISQAGLLLDEYVSAANVITVSLFNPTAGTITPASSTLKVLVFRVR
jgi:hypothetical protein